MGQSIPLKTLFASPEACLQAVVWLYGQQTFVYYQCFELFWDSPDAAVLFVLTQLPNGNRMILLSSDIKLTGDQVIAAYGKRFKIEVCFRTFVLLLGGFAYQFWLKVMDKTPRFPSNLCLADYAPSVQSQIQQKVEAFERFVNLNAIVLGILQILALELPQSVWNHFPLELFPPLVPHPAQPWLPDRADCPPDTSASTAADFFEKERGSTSASIDCR